MSSQPTRATQALQPPMTPEAACSWAMAVWQPFGIAWQPSATPPGQARVRASGRSVDRNLLIDVDVGTRQRRVVALHMAVPVRPEPEAAAQVARFVAFSLAAVSGDDATMADADAFLADALRALRRDRPSRVARAWRGWRVVFATTPAGILAVRVDRGGLL